MCKCKMHFKIAYNDGTPNLNKLSTKKKIIEILFILIGLLCAIFIAINNPQSTCIYHPSFLLFELLLLFYYKSAHLFG